MSTVTCPNTACGASLEGTDLRHCPRCGAFLPLPEADPSDPLVGQPILGGKYRILSIIGEGGMGKVYLAEQKLGTATRKVAIKTLQPDLAQDPQIIARFYRETQTVIELEHPNTIKFYDFGELEDHGKKLFVVMEFIQGESLGNVLARGPLDATRAERIMSQICGSLQEAHDRGIVHRDLKPENIYLTQKGARGDFVKVLDFGIAKRDESGEDKEAKLTRQGMVLGTPPYMSPEQFTGQTLDARSDIYALGVMAYEMLTGTLPFTAQTPWEWATKHLTAQPTPFEQVANGARVPPRHRAAIMRALRKNRDERPATVSVFLQEFAGSAAAAGDWTASSTSLPTGQAPPPAPADGTPQTPAPFAATNSGGFVPSPSNAGFAAVPPGVAAGAAGSNPGFNPTTGSGASGGFQPVHATQAAMAAPRKSRRGLIIGIIVAVVVLGGGGAGLAVYLNQDDDDDNNTTQQQRPAPTTTPPNQQGVGGPVPPSNVPTVNPQTGQVPSNIPTPPPQVLPPQTNTQPTNTQPTTPTVATNTQPTNTQTQPTTPTVATNTQPTNTQTQPTTPQNNPTTNDHPTTQPANPQPPQPALDPRLAGPIGRSQGAMGANNFPAAIAAFNEAARIDNNSPAVGRLRVELRRRAHGRINDMILSGNCGGAQNLFRQLRSAGIGPPTDSFGDACQLPM